MRIRSIKPSVFKDAELWDLGQETGYPILQAFEGLWCAADREGRFLWKPRELKTDILPYWDGDFSRVLDALESRGFIVRYACDGREYGVVRTFKIHQVLNNKEMKSSLPAPPEPITKPVTSTREPRVSHATATPLVLEQGEYGREYGREYGSGDRARANDVSEPEITQTRTRELDHWVEGLTEQTLSDGFQIRYENAVKSIPNQLQLSKMSTRVARWVEQTARLREQPEDVVMRKLLDGFFANDNARSKGFPPAFLAANPLEYFEPPKTAQDAQSAKQMASLGSVLKQLDVARAAARSSAPDSWERTKAQNDIADLEQRASKLRSATNGVSK